MEPLFAVAVFFTELFASYTSHFLFDWLPRLLSLSDKMGWLRTATVVVRVLVGLVLASLFFVFFRWASGLP